MKTGQTETLQLTDVDLSEVSAAGDDWFSNRENRIHPATRFPELYYPLVKNGLTLAQFEALLADKKYEGVDREYIDDTLRITGHSDWIGCSTGPEGISG